MDAIKTYLETMLSALPKTEESFRLKNELLISMEEKYNELKAAGKSENEAIGTVISEFGNIEELMEEIELTGEKDEDDQTPVIELFTVQAFLAQLRETAKYTAAGVFLILFGVAALLLGFTMSGLFTNDVETQIAIIITGIVSFVLLLAPAAGMLAFTWLKMLKYDFIAREFKLPEHVKQYVYNIREKSMSKNIALIAVGVTIVVLSTIAVIIPAIAYGSVNPILTGVSIFLVALGIGTAPLIVAGLSIASLGRLLGLVDEDEWFTAGIRIDSRGINIGAGGFTISKGGKIIGVVSAIFWPLVVAAYLLWSFLGSAWSISWVLFPIAALVFAAFAGGVGAFTHLDSDKK